MAPAISSRKVVLELEVRELMWQHPALGFSLITLLQQRKFKMVYGDLVEVIKGSLKRFMANFGG